MLLGRRCGRREARGELLVAGWAKAAAAQRRPRRRRQRSNSMKASALCCALHQPFARGALPRFVSAGNLLVGGQLRLRLRRRRRRRRRKFAQAPANYSLQILASQPANELAKAGRAARFLARAYRKQNPRFLGAFKCARSRLEAPRVVSVRLGLLALRCAVGRLPQTVPLEA